jgi:threonine-phosphate decarboxylase
MQPMAITHGGDIFAIARAHGWDWRDVLDFSASINPLGPAPGVRQAICQSVDRIVHYPEREPQRLRRALAQTWNLDEDQIILGNGATELIFFIARVFPNATLSLPVFSEFHRAFPNAGDSLLVLTRPANPTGSILPLDAIPNRAALIDESFLEFSGHPSAATLLPTHPQLIILRSLTKFYALPGLRIGALVATAATAHKWRAQREPWQVNVLAEEAALAAIADTNHAARSIDFVRTERAWLLQQLSEIPGAHPQPSDANFLYVPLDYPAAPLCDHLLRHKILIRNFDNAVRIAVRRRADNEKLLAAWREFPCV